MSSGGFSLAYKEGCPEDKGQGRYSIENKLEKKMANIFVDKTGPPMVPPWIMTVNIESEN